MLEKIGITNKWSIEWKTTFNSQNLITESTFIFLDNIITISKDPLLTILFSHMISLGPKGDEIYVQTQKWLGKKNKLYFIEIAYPIGLYKVKRLKFSLVPWDDAAGHWPID